MKVISAELRGNALTQLFLIAAIAVLIVLFTVGETAWQGVLGAATVVFGPIGFFRSWFVPREKIIPAAIAWIVLSALFIPVLLYVWFASRPPSSWTMISIPMLAAAVAYIPAGLVRFVRRNNE